MTPDELDRILSSEDLPVPSSNFAAEVMAAVRRPKFPWLRFAAGVSASITTAAAGTVLLIRSSPALSPLAAVAPELAYSAAAVLLSLGIAAIPWSMWRTL